MPKAQRTVMLERLARAERQVVQTLEAVRALFLSVRRELEGLPSLPRQERRRAVAGLITITAKGRRALREDTNETTE